MPLIRPSISSTQNYVDPPRYSPSRRKMPECALCGRTRSRAYHESKVPEPLVCSPCIKRANEKSDALENVVEIHHHHHHYVPSVTSNLALERSASELPITHHKSDQGKTSPVELAGIGVTEVDGIMASVEMLGNTRFISRSQRYLGGRLSPIYETPPDVNYAAKPSSLPY
jgi:hypothetical protein